MIRALPVVVVTLTALTGCAAATLPYTPAQQPPGARVSAAYQVIGDRLRVEVNPDGRWLEEVEIIRPDGSRLRPLAVEAGPITTSSPAVSFGVGVGGGSWSGGSGVGVGTGVSVGGPVGSGRVDTNMFAYFPVDDAGPPPWRVRVKLAGTEPAIILVGAVPSGTTR